MTMEGNSSRIRWRRGGGGGGGVSGAVAEEAACRVAIVMVRLVEVLGTIRSKL